MIVTLAGHVDHGKTSLVRCLTGVDTDRLAEEKRRGLTIDLGFAYLRDPVGTLGFVDVPGHHRFIHNMVAGIAATQQALLVVAADDGPMPQTREHLQILQLLGVGGGVVALSKCDRVSPGRLRQAGDEVAALVAGTFLAHAPVVATSTTGGIGIDEVRRRLLAAASTTPAAASGQPFRLAVDRAFSLKGTGLVVTGTVHAGSVVLEDAVHAFPGGDQARVRGLHVQDRPAQRAVCGDRAALNLTGLDLPAFGRGGWLTAQPDAGHHSLVIELEVLDDFPRVLRHRMPVHVYHATTHATAHLALLDGARLEPGGRARVELLLDRPLLGKRGDRLVLRDHGLERTLGGGVVIDNRPASGRRRSPARLRSIDACAAPDADASLTALLGIGPVSIAAFRRLWPMTEAYWQDLLRARAVTASDDALVAAPLWQSWLELLLAECRQRHDADSALRGLRENDFAAAVPESFRGRVLADLAAAGELTQQAGRFRPRRHQVTLSVDESRLFERLRPLLDQAQPPSLGDIARTLGMPLAQLQRAARALAGKRVVVMVNDKRVFLPLYVERFADAAVDLALRGPFTARAFRDSASIGRNVAIDVLEFFDARGFTRRRDDRRVVTGERSRLTEPLG